MDRLDEMAQIVRDLGAQVANLRASVTTLQSRLGVLESQLSEALVAHASLATEIEHLRADGARLSALEKSLARQSESRHELGIEVGEELRRSLAEATRRQEMQSEHVSHELATLAQRLERMETSIDPGALSHQIGTLAQTVNGLAARLEDMLQDRRSMEETARQREARVEAELSELRRQIVDQAQRLAGWQERIDAQTETVRRGQALAEKMTEEARDLQRQQHELAQAQRLWEERHEARLAEHWERWQAEWQMLQATWAQEEKRRERQQEATEAAIRSLEAKLAELLSTLEHQADTVEEQRRAQAEAGQRLRQDILHCALTLRDQLAKICQELEAGLPSAERPSVVEQRRLAERRELRARRGHTES